jgi:GNAT superfamily N-acetyltransferase
MRGASEVRQFCLDVIREAYGYEYNPEWHADLDSLLRPDGVYSRVQGGYMAVVRGGERIIGCGGLRALSSNSVYWKRFKERYADQNTGALWRVYVDRLYRGRGIGKDIVADLEKQAVRLGYQKL